MCFGRGSTPWSCNGIKGGSALPHATRRHRANADRVRTQILDRGVVAILLQVEQAEHPYQRRLLARQRVLACRQQLHFGRQPSYTQRLRAATTFSGVQRNASHTAGSSRGDGGDFGHVWGHHKRLIDAPARPLGAWPLDRGGAAGGTVAERPREERIRQQDGFVTLHDLAGAESQYPSLLRLALLCFDDSG